MSDGNTVRWLRDNPGKMHLDTVMIRRPDHLAALQKKDEEIATLQSYINKLELSNIRRYSAFGKTLSVKQWSVFSGIKQSTIASRILKGWKIERAVSESATVGNNQYLRY